MLGYRPGRTTLQPHLLSMVKDHLDRAISTFSAQASSLVCSVRPLENQSYSLADSFLVQGKTVNSALQGSVAAILGALTLGPEFDARVQELSNGERLTEAVIMDAIGSAAIEDAADLVHARLCSQVREYDQYLTHRVSPGYGDFALEVQPGLLAMVKASAIGLTAKPSFMLQPNKSITFLAGIKTGTPPPLSAHRCARCNATNCPFRKRETDSAVALDYTER